MRAAHEHEPAEGPRGRRAAAGRVGRPAAGLRSRTRFLHWPEGEYHRRTAWLVQAGPTRCHHRHRVTLCKVFVVVTWDNDPKTGQYPIMRTVKFSVKNLSKYIKLCC